MDFLSPPLEIQPGRTGDTSLRFLSKIPCYKQIHIALKASVNNNRNKRQQQKHTLSSRVTMNICVFYSWEQKWHICECETVSKQ